MGVGGGGGIGTCVSMCPGIVWIINCLLNLRISCNQTQHGGAASWAEGHSVFALGSWQFKDGDP